MKEFSLSIYTPEMTLFKAAIVSLRVPAEAGSLGVLADHAPLIASLAAGKIIVRTKSGETLHFASLGNGFLEVSGNKAAILLSRAG